MTLTFMLFIPQPRSLTFSNFELYVKQTGPFAGRECLNLKDLKTEKKHVISLGQPTLRNEQGYHDMVANPSDPFCIVRIYKLFRAHLPDDWTGEILRRPKPYKEVRKLIDNQKGLFVMMADLGPAGKFGKNYPTEICRRTAMRCGFDNVLRHTASGRRRTAITELSSSEIEVPAAELQKSSRHKDPTTSANYQSGNENAHAKRYQAQFYNGSSTQEMKPAAAEPAFEAKAFSSPAIVPGLSSMPPVMKPAAAEPPAFEPKAFSTPAIVPQPSSMPPVSERPQAVYVSMPPPANHPMQQMVYFPTGPTGMPPPHMYQQQPPIYHPQPIYQQQQHLYQQQPPIYQPVQPPGYHQPQSIMYPQPYYPPQQPYYPPQQPYYPQQPAMTYAPAPSKDIKEE